MFIMRSDLRQHSPATKILLKLAIISLIVTRASFPLPPITQIFDNKTSCVQPFLTVKKGQPPLQGKLPI